MRRSQEQININRPVFPFPDVMKTTFLRHPWAVFAILTIFLTAPLRAVEESSNGLNENPEPGFWNWPGVTLTPQVGIPNARDVTIHLEATFPNLQPVSNWGRATLREDGVIAIAMQLPGAEVMLPAIDEKEHTYVLNQDPQTAWIAVVDPNVTRQHLDLADGEYTVVFSLNEKILAETHFTLPTSHNGDPENPNDPSGVKVQFTGFYVYGSGVPFAGISGTLKFTQPIGYLLDQSSLGDDDLTIAGANGETLAATFMEVAILESYPEQIVISYKIATPVFDGAPESRSYQVSLRPNTLTFNNGAAALPGGPVGVLELEWPEASPAVAVSLMEPPPPVKTASREPVYCTVAFDAASPFDPPIDSRTIGNDDIFLASPRSNVQRFARFVEFYPTFAPGTALVRYAFDPPREAGWTEKDNGTYLLTLKGGSVATYPGLPNLNGGPFLPEQTLGVLFIDIPPVNPPPPPSDEAPIVVAEARNLYATPLEPVRDIIPYQFRLLVIDGSGVDLTTLPGATVLVKRYDQPVRMDLNGEVEDPTEPSVATWTAILTQVTALDPGTTVAQIDAELIAPDGIWDGTENGHYLIFLSAGQVADTDGHQHAGGIVGHFSVMIHPLSDDAVEVGDGWTYAPFLGYFNDQTFPWYSHPEHGWWYAAHGLEGVGTPAKDDWFYDLAMKRWLFTGAAVYPFLYSTADGEWLYYFPGTKNPRYFHGVESGHLLTDAEPDAQESNP